MRHRNKVQSRPAPHEEQAKCGILEVTGLTSQRHRRKVKKLMATYTDLRMQDIGLLLESGIPAAHE